MAVAFDAFSDVAAATTTPLSWTHTPSGTPAGAIVLIIADATTLDRITSVTYGGTSMTRVGTFHSKGSSEYFTTYLYFLGASVPSGAQTVLVHNNGATVSKRAGAITLTADTDTEVVDEDISIESDAEANPTGTLSLGGRTSFAAIVFGSGRPGPANITPLTNWTDQLEHDFGASSAGWYTYDIIGSADVTIGWSQGSDDTCASALAVSEVAVAGFPVYRKTDFPYLKHNLVR